MRRWTFTPAQGVPAPVAPYVHATAAGGLLCVTGQMPIDAASGRLVAGGIGEQTAQVLLNLGRVLELCGAGWSQVLHARAYLVSMDLFGAFNAAYEGWLGSAALGSNGLPARTCVAVDGLALGALVEIDLPAAHAEPPA